MHSNSSKRGRPKVSRKELAAWTHRMGPVLQRDFVLDMAILGLLANWCGDCDQKHPVAPLLEDLLIALCDGDMDQVDEYVTAARLFVETLGGSVKKLFQEDNPIADLNAILQSCRIELSQKNKPKNQKR